MIRNLFKKRKEKIDEDALLAGKKLVEEMQQENKVEQKPSNIQIDFFATKKEKELREFLIGFAEKHFLTPRNSRYCAIKFENGYIYELQENGGEKGFLSDVLKKINEKENVIIELSDKRRVRISKEGSKIKTISLTEDDKGKTTLLEKKDKMLSLYTPNLSLLVFGLSLTSVGILALLTSFIFKYILLNENKEIEFYEIKYKTPYEASLDDQMKINEFEKINKMEYTENKGWKYDKVSYEEK